MGSETMETPLWFVVSINARGVLRAVVPLAAAIGLSFVLPWADGGPIFAVPLQRVRLVSTTPVPPIGVALFLDQAAVLRCPVRMSARGRLAMKSSRLSAVTKVLPHSLTATHFPWPISSYALVLPMLPARRRASGME